MALFDDEAKAIEIEAKFSLRNIEQADAVLRFVALRGDMKALEPIFVVDRYFDDPRQQLATSGYCLRLRGAGQVQPELEGEMVPGFAWSAELKSLQPAASAIHERVEINQPLSEPILPEELVDGPVGLCLQKRQINPDVLRFIVENRRRRYLLARESGAELEIVVDSCQVLRNDGTRLTSFLELEIELLEGERIELEELSAELVAELGLRPSLLGKFERAKLAAKDWINSAEHAHQGSPLKRKLALYLEKVLAYRRLAIEGIDTDGLRRTRSNLRRLRVLLRSASALWGDQVLVLEQELAGLARSLGPVRDLEVVLQSCDRVASTCGVAPKTWDALGQRLQSEQAAVYRRGRLVLESARCDDLLARVGALVAAIEDRTGDKRLRKHARSRLVRRYKRLRRLGRDIESLSPHTDLHRLRLQIKKFRYLLESYADLLEEHGKPVRKSLKTLQGLLGDHQDACVVADYLTALAEDVPLHPRGRDQLLALGALRQWHLARADQLRRQLPRVWQRFDQQVSLKRVRKLVSSP